MLEVQSIPEIHQSQDDIHLIVDKAHKIQASTQYCVNILLHSSQQLRHIRTSSKPMPLYHYLVLPVEAYGPSIEIVDQ